MQYAPNDKAEYRHRLKRQHKNPRAPRNEASPPEQFEYICLQKELKGTPTLGDGLIKNLAGLLGVDEEELMMLGNMKELEPFRNGWQPADAIHEAMEASSKRELLLIP